MLIILIRRTTKGEMLEIRYQHHGKTSDLMCAIEEERKELPTKVHEIQQQQQLHDIRPAFLK